MRNRIIMPVDPVLRIPDKPIDPQLLVDRAINAFLRFERDRAEWIRRRETYYLGWDDYSTPARKGLWESSSNLRFPLTEVQAGAMHALLMQAVFFYYPLFFVDPQEEVAVEKIKKIELLMKYILERYVNYNKGIYLAVDDWAWDLTTEGIGIFSRGWDVLQRKFITVERNPEFQKQQLNLQNMLEDTDEKDFAALTNELVKMPYVEKSVIRTVFNGPTVVAEDPVFILFKGEVVDSTDLNEHQTVIKVCYFTREQLVMFRDSEYFDEELTNQILEGPSDHKVTSTIQGFSNTTRAAKDFQTGVNTSNPDNVEETWEFLCVYDTCCLNPKDRTSMPDRLQYFIRPKSRQLLRWTYLDRITSNGKIPLHMAHLFRRPRRSTGRGIVQTMYNSNDCLDILVNQAIDAGTLANNPMFGYRQDSSFDPQEVRIEPGLGIPMDNPQQDIYFFRWGVNPNWSDNIMGTISGMAQQLTAIGPQTVGQIGENVGPLRSTSGVQTMSQAANIIHDVVIKRAKICISELFEGLYSDCYQRMPDRIKIAVTGAEGIPLMNEDGTPMTAEISREELSHRVRFGLYATSNSMNKQKDQADAMAIAQLLIQKIGLETGVVTPTNVYEIYQNALRSLGVPHQERFINKPTPDTALSMKYELQMIMEGEMPPISLRDAAREEKLLKYNELLNSDVAAQEAQFGIVSPRAMEILKKVIKAHMVYQETLNKPSNMENPHGNNQSPTAGQQNVSLQNNQNNSQNIKEAVPQQGNPQAQPQQGLPGGGEQ